MKCKVLPVWSTANEELFSEELEFCKSSLPHPRKQDQVNKDELVTRYSVVSVKVQSGVALKLAQYVH